MRDPEILVHVAAPSGARDDARYRSQIQAFLAFDPVSRHCVFSSEDGSSCEPPAEEAVRFPEQSGGDEKSGHSGDELRSVVDESSSPGVTAREADPKSKDQEAKLGSTHPPPPSTTFGDNAPNCGRDPPTDDQHPGPGGVSHTLPADCVSHRDGPPSSVSALQQGASVSNSFETPLSVIPDSQPHEPNSSAGNSERANHAPVEQVQVPRSFYAEPSSPSKRRRLDNAGGALQSAEADNVRILSSLPSSNGCAPPEKQTEIYTHENRPINAPNVVYRASGPPDNKPQTIPRQDHTISLSVLPLEIHPPPPPVSTGRFQTHITPTLQMLAERMKLPRKFKPAKQSRELEPLERGYWFLQVNVFESDNIDRGDCGQEAGCGRVKANNHSPNDWSLSFFCQFWSFLTDFISREGRAGWGVWGILEEKRQNHASQQTEPAANPLDQQQEQPQNRKLAMRRPLTLKVYCWGEVAPHIYMLLFLATERRIRGMRAQWRDATESVVIEMP
ncbi:hypothetical protein VTN96DRAFT_3614 [Rasamsonia emersonii]|uniref:Uncharacterized protein n=1 Tax=Rasamsonia emersonii (strain ATCC 16479 / CBS 393.64 / IMI 116815) TaxID=1408163 RepID=A0A0F4YR98_RASE3|nr:hypothetical protein T310_5833 [Rasamsonia emersonii CBS 393.64]KKA20133.1 hypothetical protein T310_5833 [Rasamsonia emersonii CBS 393.64]